MLEVCVGMNELLGVEMAQGLANKIGVELEKVMKQKSCVLNRKIIVSVMVVGVVFLFLFDWWWRSHVLWFLLMLLVLSLSLSLSAIVGVSLKGYHGMSRPNRLHTLFVFYMWLISVLHQQFEKRRKGRTIKKGTE